MQYITLFIYLYSYIRLFYGIPENIDLWVCVQVQWWFEINSNISIPTGGIDENLIVKYTYLLLYTVTTYCFYRVLGLHTDFQLATIFFCFHFLTGTFFYT